MSLKPETSVLVGLATATAVYGIYTNALPPVVDIKDTPPSDDMIGSTEKTAAWLSAAVVAGISLITKDPTVFVLGGSMVIALSWWNRHANEVNPQWGTVTAPSGFTPEMFDENNMADFENEG